MQRSLAVAVLVCALAGSAAAARVAAPTRTAVAAVAALAADGDRAAFATAWTRTSCERTFLWRWTTDRQIAFPPPRACPQVSTGRGITAISLAGNRVLWLSYAGGNDREWSLLTATTTAPRPRLLRFAVADPGGPAPIVLGGSDRGLLPYAVGSSVVVLRANGARAFAWTAPARVVALAAGGGRVAVGEQGNRVAVLDGGGNVVDEQTYGRPVVAVALPAAGLLVQDGLELDLRSDGATQTWQLPAGARLQDAAGDLAVYTARGAVHVLRLSTGADRVAAAGTVAQLAGTRLVVASGRRVSVLPAG